jgi:sarcosine oxidase subunit beta
VSRNVTDVVVIGGGISGAAAAYELARAGAAVTLIEKGALASMASGWTLAGVRQSGRHPAELPLAQAAVARWATLSEELGADVEYRGEGNLRLARTPDEVQTIAGIVSAQQALGLDLTLLSDNAAVRTVAPALADTILAASFCPTDGHANPTATVQAFAAAAQRHGADIRTQTAATAIETGGGRVQGVRTTAGAIAADAVVVAAGVYGAQFCAPLGIDLPIAISHVSVVQTVPLPPLIAQVLGVASADLALRQEVGGRVRFTGGGAPWPYDLDALGTGNDPVMPPTSDVAAALDRAVEALPALAAAPLSGVWGGLLDMTPDALPVIERSPQIEGLIIAAGFSGHGFCLGPITGEIVRDLVRSGTTPYPIAPFRSERLATVASREAATLHG